MNMTMAEATELAMEIMRDRRVMVVAIGRFRLLEELVRDGAEELPWGVSVAARDNPGQRATVWSHELWRDFRDLLPGVHQKSASHETSTGHTFRTSIRDRTAVHAVLNRPIDLAWMPNDSGTYQSNELDRTIRIRLFQPRQ